MAGPRSDCTTSFCARMIETMTQVILKLLHTPLSETTRLVDAAIAFRGTVGLGWVAAFGLVLGVGTVWMYRATTEGLPAWRKYTLAALRVIFLFFVLSLLLRPVLVLTVENSVRRSLVLLLDATSSMTIKDQRHDDTDLKRVAVAKNLIDP